MFQMTDDQTLGSSDVDTFEHILEVTKYQEAVIAYYYLDDDNKMKMTQIFDLTNSENPSGLDLGAQDINDQLEVESDCEANHTGKILSCKSIDGWYLIYYFDLYFSLLPPAGISKPAGL